MAGRTVIDIHFYDNWFFQKFWDYTFILDQSKTNCIPITLSNVINPMQFMAIQLIVVRYQLSVSLFTNLAFV